MENLEKAINDLKIQIENQNKNIRDLNHKLKNNEVKTQKHHTEMPRYQMNSTKYHLNNNGECYRKEYNFKETVYFHGRKQNFNDSNYLERNEDIYYKKKNTLPTNSISQHSTNPAMYSEVRAHTRNNCNETILSQFNSFEKPKKNKFFKNYQQKLEPLTETELKMRQNHLPFLVDKARSEKKCSGCFKNIYKNSTIIIHKEIKTYKHSKYGWDQPIYSKIPIHHFYHFDKICLNLRGFENIYLSLCHIEVTCNIGHIDKLKIKELGFQRPVRDKIKEKENQQIVKTFIIQEKMIDTKIEDSINQEFQDTKDTEINESKIENCIDQNENLQDNLINSNSDTCSGISDEDFLECTQNNNAKDDLETLEFDFCD